MQQVTPGHRMRKEIIEQPEAIAATLAAETDRIRAFAERLRKSDISQVLVVARGASDNAGMYAQYVFGVLTGRIAMMAPLSLLTVYDADLDLSRSLVLGISQSGQSADVVEYLQAARERGALTCAITNARRAPIKEAAEVVLSTHAREERSVPATKTYTTALAVVHQLAALWGGDVRRAAGIYKVPEWIEAVLRTEGEIQARAERYRYMDTCTVLGRGLNLCTALEAALKLAECTYVVPARYGGAEFLHGPVASISQGMPCLVFAPEGKTLQSMSELVDALEERQAETIIVSNFGPMLDRAAVGFSIPDMPEEFSPLVAAVVAQLFALHLGLHKGIDPDRPRGLQKVTLTL